jgi:translation initiation factor IF-1
MKEDVFEMNGVVVLALPNAMFKVQLENGIMIICHISGKIRKNMINILVGDKVVAEVSKYDITKGRIIFRTKG